MFLLPSPIIFSLAGWTRVTHTGAFLLPALLFFFPPPSISFSASTNSTAELLTMCCSRRIQRVELDPNNIAVRGRDGKLDTLGAFAKGEIVCALRGHPACVQDLCRSLHDERSLFLRKREFLENDIPRVRDGVGRWRGREGGGRGRAGRRGLVGSSVGVC